MEHDSDGGADLLSRYGNWPRHSPAAFCFFQNRENRTKSVNGNAASYRGSIFLLPFRLSVANARPIDSDVDLFTRGHNKRQEP